MIEHDRIGETGGPVMCPNCEVPTKWWKCMRCDHEFVAPWLGTAEEYEKIAQQHSMSGFSRVPVPSIFFKSKS